MRQSKMWLATIGISLLSLVGAPKVMAAPVSAACKAEAQKLCPDIKLKKASDKMQCMAQNNKKLSSGCQKQFADTMKLASKDAKKGSHATKAKMNKPAKALAANHKPVQTGHKATPKPVKAALASQQEMKTLAQKETAKALQEKRQSTGSEMKLAARPLPKKNTGFKHSPQVEEDSPSGSGFLFNFVILLLIGGFFAGAWLLFEHEGIKPWKGLIPFYNLYLITQMVGKPAWWTAAMAIPLVGSVFGYFTFYELAKKYGKPQGYAIAMGICPFVMVPVLAMELKKLPKPAV